MTTNRDEKRFKLIAPKKKYGGAVGTSNRLHRYSQRTTFWLVEILKTELRTNLCGNEIKSVPLRKIIDYAQGKGMI